MDRNNNQTGRDLALPTLIAAALMTLGVSFAAGAELPAGVTANDTDGTYSIATATKRSVAQTMESFATWQHQQFQDRSTAAFTYEDGLLSMECSACGLTGSSVIALRDVDLSSIVAYQAGYWRVRMQSQDGTQVFSGLLRGEPTSPPPDPTAAEADQRVALQALQDLYDLASVAQGKAAATGNAPHAPEHPAGPGVLSRSPAPAASKGGTVADLSVAGDVDELWALSTIRKRKDGGRPAPPGELGRALVVAYGQKARSLLLKGSIEEALATLAEGRRTFGTSEQLKDLETEADLIADAYDRLSSAVVLNVNQQREYLATIQNKDAAGYEAIEDMLARTLANRIADESVAQRPVIVANLSASGRLLFPRQADGLSRGTAGVLPQTSLPVDSGARVGDGKVQ